MEQPIESRTQRVLRAALSLFFVLQGINHFVLDEFFVRAMPDWLPAHGWLVAISGAIEIGLGLGVLVPRARRVAGLGLVALLFAVFPANIEMALHPERWPGIPAALLWVRLPLQAGFVYWVWTCTLRPRRPAPSRIR